MPTRMPVKEPGPTATPIPVRSPVVSAASRSSRSISPRRSRAWPARSRSGRSARTSPARPRATLPREVAVSRPRQATRTSAARSQPAAPEELGDLGLLVLPFEEERGPHLVTARLPLDLLDAHHSAPKRDPGAVAPVLADDDQLLADGVRAVALEQQAALADVARFGRGGGVRGLRLARRGHADPDRPACHVEADEGAALPVIDPDAVPAARLGLVHRLLGALHQAVRGRRVLRVLGDADRDGHRDRASVDVPAQEVALDLLADPLRHQKRPHPLGLGEDQAELLAGQARPHVDVPDPVLEEDGDLAQQDVPHQVTVPLVDLPEIVDVEVEGAQIEVVALGAPALLLERGEEVAGVPEAGQRVDGRGRLLPIGHRQVDDARAGELPVEIDEIVQRRHPQARLPLQRLSEDPAVLQDLLPVPARLRLLERQVGQDEQQGGIGLQAALGADLVEPLQDPFLVVRVLPQDGQELVPIAGRLLERDHGRPSRPGTSGSAIPARRPATRNRASASAWKETPARRRGSPAAPGAASSCTTSARTTREGRSTSRGRADVSRSASCTSLPGSSRARVKSRAPPTERSRTSAGVSAPSRRTVATRAAPTPLRGWSRRSGRKRRAASPPAARAAASASRAWLPRASASQARSGQAARPALQVVPVAVRSARHNRSAACCAPPAGVHGRINAKPCGTRRTAWSVSRNASLTAAAARFIVPSAVAPSPSGARTATARGRPKRSPRRTSSARISSIDPGPADRVARGAPSPSSRKIGSRIVPSRPCRKSRAATPSPGSRPSRASSEARCRSISSRSGRAAASGRSRPARRCRQART